MSNKANPAALSILKTFTRIKLISGAQSAAIAAALRGSDAKFFVDKLSELSRIFSDMPRPYGQDGKGMEAIVYLRYFGGSEGQALIIERDGTDEQHQAFGLVDLFGDGGELGFVSIPEMTENGWELDLHWTPKTRKEAEQKQD